MADNFVALLPSSIKASDTSTYSRTAVRANPTPLPDSLFSGALGDVIFQKIAHALLHANTNIVTQAFTTLNDLLRTSTNVIKCTQTHDFMMGVETDEFGRGNVFQGMVLRLTHSDDGVRILASRSFVHFTRIRFGREHVLQMKELNALFAVLASLLSDPVDEVSENIYDLLGNLVDSPQGLRVIVADSELLPLVVKKCDEAKHVKIQAAALRFTTTVMNKSSTGYDKCIEAGLVSSLVQTLAQTTNTDVQDAATRCAFFLCVQAKGKQLSVDFGAAPLLVRLLGSTSESVRVNASGALVHIANALPGKVAVISGGGVAAAIKHLDDESTAVLANCLNIIINVAEHPSSKSALDDGVIKIINDISIVTKDTAVQAAAELAVARLQWHP